MTDLTVLVSQIRHPPSPRAQIRHPRAQIRHPAHRFGTPQHTYIVSAEFERLFLPNLGAGGGVPDLGHGHCTYL